MKLYVDDIRNAPDHTWTVARTVLSSIRAIAQFDFEEISLDHDISHQVTVGALGRPYPCDETFESVAWFIGVFYAMRARPKNQLKRVILHTSNPVGATAMEQVLRRYLGMDIEIIRAPMGAVNRLEMNI